MIRQWWNEKVAYQIYPKSFCDSDGDGIGDLQGIISKLDYLRDLGVDIVWLSPISVSPLADQGYDIADYYKIDPRFGTMDDMDELLREAHKRDMYILMDLVVNHCSDEHEWFRKAAEDPDGKYGKYFYLERTEMNMNGSGKLRKIRTANTASISIWNARTILRLSATGDRTSEARYGTSFRDTTTYIIYISSIKSSRISTGRIRSFAKTFTK